MAGPWSRDELATAAGEPEERIRRYVDAGLLHEQPDGDLEPDSLHRLRLVQFARARGFTDEQLATVTASQGDLLGIFVESMPLNTVDVNLVDAARGAGLGDDVTAELAGILGWDGETGTETDLTTLQILGRAVALGMPRDALLQLVSVFADSMDRLADAVVRTFHNHVHDLFRVQGFAGRDLLEATERIGRPMLELVEPTLLHFYRRAFQRANREDLLRHLAEETTPPAAIPGEEHATVLFVDLASFTPLTATMGDQAAADVLRRFSTTVRSSAFQHRGRILKQIGDAFMLMFTQPADAIEFGFAMDRFVDAEPLFPALHIGAHHGPILYREGDYVGATVNLAARVAAAGAAGQFLITDDLRDAAGNVAAADYASLPPRRLKGFRDPLCLVEVRRQSPERSDRQTDPVCGLLLHPDEVATQTTWHGETYAFCCELCQNAFTDNPGRFVDAQQDRRPTK